MKTRFVILILTLAVGLWLPSGCTTEHVLGMETEPEGDKVRIELCADNADSFAYPATRVGMADENMVGPTPMVLVFRGSKSSTAVFSEAVEAEWDDTENKTYVSLTRTNDPCRVLILANTPLIGAGALQFDQAGLNSTLTGQTFAEAVDNILLTTSLGIVSPEVPYIGSTIPMSAIWDLDNIGASTKIGTDANPVKLERIVAKVTVENRVGYDTFCIHGASVINVAGNGRLHQRADGELRTLATEQKTYYRNNEIVQDDSKFLVIAPASEGTATVENPYPNNTEANPLYIYESDAEDGAAVIVMGTYLGNKGYFKLAFKDIDDNLLDIRRNKHYKFVISSCSQVGYYYFSEVHNAPYMNIIEYDLVVSDLLSHDLVDNGQYYLGLSNSEAAIFDSSSPTSYPSLFYAYTDVKYPLLYNFVNYSTSNAGLGNTWDVMPAAGKNQIGVTYGETDFEETAFGGTFYTDFLIGTKPMFYGFAYDGSVGSISFTMGNLYLLGFVFRQPSVGGFSQTIAFEGDYIEGEILTRPVPEWVTISSQETGGTSGLVAKNPAGNLYVRFNKNASWTPRVVELMFVRKSADGKVRRMRVFMKQEGTYS